MGLITTGIIITKYPNILGTDVAGEVFEVGEGVTRFKKGQRVIGHQINLGDNLPKHGAFQEYPVVYEALASPIPDDLPYEQAVVLPLSISTAAYGLYVKDCLGLPPPTTRPKPSEKTILIWGASSSVGSSAVQLATASGVSVIGVASKRNHDYVRSLGAKEVLDYHDPSIVDDAINYLEKGQFVGIYDAICEGETLPTCVKIAERLGGGRIACVLEPYGDIPGNVKATFCELLTIVLAGFDMLMSSRSRFSATPEGSGGHEGGMERVHSEGACEWAV